LVIVIDPEPLVIEIPVPAVKVLLVNPVPFPISKAPLVGVEVKPVPPFAIGKVPVTPVLNGKPVALVKTPLAGVPKAGVTRVGDVFKTTDPDPVDAVTPVPPPAGCNTPEEFICELSIATLFACVMVYPISAFTSSLG
jgi:hypothetical protein